MPLDDLYRQVQRDRLHRYEEAIASGKYRPFIWPWDTLPALYLFLGLLILPRLSRPTARLIRVPLLMVIFGQGIWVCIRCRSIGMAGGYGIGLANDWGFIMSGALLLFNDVGKDFQRLEERDITTQLHESNGSAEATGKDFQNGVVKRPASDLRVTVQSAQRESRATRLRSTTLVWQGYPQSLLHCTYWLIDLLTAFRGPHWSYRFSIFPPFEGAPPRNTSSNPRPSTAPQATPALKRTLRQIQLSAHRSFIIHYLLVDLAKSIVIHDPYFLGLASLDSPHPLWLLQPYPFLARLTRLVTSFICVILALGFIFQLSPLLFPLLRLFPFTHPSTYPPYWSPHPLTSISTSGLAAFWGQCWHQMFRFGITQPATYLIRRFQIPPKSDLARGLHVMLAFLATGSIHALAAATSWPADPARPPRPVWGSGAFFVSQGVGVLGLEVLGRWLGGWRRWGRGWRVVGNWVGTVGWLYLTGPLLADDFARCGIWLFEPVPVSIVRGGLGERWWCWGGRWVGLVNEGGWRGWGVGVY